MEKRLSGVHSPQVECDDTDCKEVAQLQAGGVATEEGAGESSESEENSALVKILEPLKGKGKAAGGCVELKWCAFIKHSWFVEEAIQLVKLAVPLFLTLIAQQMAFVMSILYMGHVSGSAVELDGTALGISFINITGGSFVSGLATAADTLCSQSFGYKNYKRVGVVLQRGILIAGLACLPIAVVWLNCEPLLLLARQQPCVVRLTGLYVKTSVLILPGLVVFTMLERYLEAQSIVWTFVFVNLLLFAISAALHPLLIYGANFGVVGASLANVLAYTITTIAMIVYIWFRGLHKKTWGGWSWQSLDEWGQFLKIGIPGLLIMCFEWWSFEISFLVTGAIDKTQLGVNSIMAALEYNSYMVPFGIALAASIRVGNELGAGRPHIARRIANTAMILGGILAVVMLAFFLATKNVLPKLFTRDEDVLKEMDTAMYGLIMVTSLDSIQAMCSGILRGSGRQRVGATVSLFSYYFSGLPIGISLALLTDLGAFGMWIGLAIANAIQSSLYLFLVLKTDWKRQSEIAMKNASDSVMVVEPTVTHTDNEKRNNTKELDSTGNSLLGNRDDELCNDDIIPLMSYQEQDDQDATEKSSFTEDIEVRTTTRKLRTKLYLVKGTFFFGGLVILLLGIILALVFQTDNVRLDSFCRNESCIDSACNSSAFDLVSLTDHNSTLNTSTMSYSVVYS